MHALAPEVRFCGRGEFFRSLLDTCASPFPKNPRQGPYRWKGRHRWRLSREIMSRQITDKWLTQRYTSARMDARKLANAVCPGIIHSQVRYKDLLRHLLQPGVRWLDLGCGHELIRPWALLPEENEISFTHTPALSVGVDSDGPALRMNRCIPNRVAANICALPFADCSFDVVTANMVLEHVDNPTALLSEVWRILCPEGVFLFHTPNRYYPQSVLARLLPEQIKSRLVALVTNRSERDVYPTFYRINTGSAISDLSQAVGFRIKYSETVETLTYNPHRLLFLMNLILAWLLRRTMLARFQADFLVMLCKPDVQPALRRRARHSKTAA
jgi:SAM-dependent methyltransferase